MRMPGFTADIVLQLPVQTHRQRLSNVQQERAAIIPALFTTWPCYSRGDGSVGWCWELCTGGRCSYGND